MKGILYFVLAMMAIIAVALTTEDNGPETAVEEKTNNEIQSVQAAKSMSSATIVDGLDEVSKSLAELKTELDKTSIKENQINALAEQLGEDWDKIEKQVEEKYPEDYVYIEKSLYPLLAEAKKEDPNLVDVKQLLEDTTKKVNSFKEKLT